MPIIKISGAPQDIVEEYSKRIDDISKLVNASPQNIIVICENSITYPKVENKSPIYVTVEWMKREDKEKILTDHLINFFKKYANKVWVFFTDVNGKIYIDGNKIG